jgi:hypothetical protein
MYLPEDDGILYAEECGGSVVSIGSGQLVELAQRYADRNIEITHELAIQLQKPYDMSVTYDCFLSSHIVNYHELRLDNPYIKIINLHTSSNLCAAAGNSESSEHHETGA